MQSLATERVAGQDIAADARQTSAAPRAPGIAVVVAVAAVALPIVVAVAAVASRTWYPVGDHALELLRIDEVGGSRTPLTGAWSRWGWDHPGPLLFWLLAPFTWVFGPVGMLVGTGAISCASAVGAVLVARRRGGGPIVAFVALVVVLLCTGLGPTMLVDPWNPWVAVLPFITYLVLVWSVADGDVAVAPWLVVTGSFVVQAHVGYAPLVAGLTMLAAAMAWRTRRRQPPAADAQPVRRSVLLAAGVGAVLWLPPIVQQLTGDAGNLAAILRYASDPEEPSAGWRTAWGVMGQQLGFPGAWLRGDEYGVFGLATGSAIPAAVLLAGTGVLGILAARRGARAAGRLTVVALVASALALVSTAQVTGGVFDYVVRWWWVVAACVWLSVLVSAWSLLRPHGGVAALAALGTGALIAVVLAWRAADTELPNDITSRTMAELMPDITPELDPGTTYLLEAYDARGWGWAVPGLFAELDRRGFDVAVPEPARPAFEEWHTARPDEIGARVIVVGEDDLDSDVVLPAEATEIARHDPLTPDDRERYEELRRDIADVLGPNPGARPVDVDGIFGRAVLEGEGVDPAVIKEFADLRKQGSAYVVYLVRRSAPAP